MLRPYLKKYMVTHSTPIIIAEQDFLRPRLFHENYKGFYSSHDYLTCIIITNILYLLSLRLAIQQK